MTVHITAVRLWRNGGWQTFPVSSEALDDLIRQNFDAGGFAVVGPDPPDPDGPCSGDDAGHE